MIETKNLDEYNLDNGLGEAFCELNFGFCPESLLKLHESKYENIISFLRKQNKKNQTLKKELAVDLVEAVRFFYICYSFKLSHFEDKLDRNHYFYFQPFIIAGSKYIPCIAEFGFMNENEVMDSISQISDIFIPSQHEKALLNLPVSTENKVESYKVKDIIKIMSEWTALKTKEMLGIFSLDKEASQNLIRIANLIDENSKSKKNKATQRKRIKKDDPPKVQRKKTQVENKKNTSTSNKRKKQ